MDPLRAELIWVKDRCYRQNEVSWPSREGMGVSGGKGDREWMDEDRYGTYEDEPVDCARFSLADIEPPERAASPEGYIGVETEDTDECLDKNYLDSLEEELNDSDEPVQKCSIQKIDVKEMLLDSTEIRQSDNKTSWRLSLPVASIYFGRLIGHQGSFKKQLETETGCRVIVPSKGSTGRVEITSLKSADSVDKCRQRINLIVSSAREKADFTHFISISLATSEITQSFKQFKLQVLNCPQVANNCKDESLFHVPSTLHMTIGMLALHNEEERIYAKTVINKCIEKQIRPFVGEKMLTVKVADLEIMNDDPSCVHVLYAKISLDSGDNHFLQTMVDCIADTVSQTGLMPRRKEARGCADSTHVKLHMTLMNSRYRREKEEKTKGKWESDMSMDVTEILSKYGNWHFGKVPITEFHLSQLHATVDEGKYYPATAVVRL